MENKEYRITLRKIYGHLKTVLVHKYHVGRYCFMCHLYLQGITHDLSKFSPKEFLESCRYWSGTRSPIDLCKEVNTYSKAWFHHRGRNYHHWEMWVDNFEKGMTAVKMPYKYALEMFCDFMGAGQAYWGKDFTLEAEIMWWKNKRQVAVMHEDTKALIDYLFGQGWNLKKNMKNKSYRQNIKAMYESGAIKQVHVNWRDRNEQR